MGLFDNFPYTNFHELNLDWILKMLQQIDKTMSEFVSINALKYADPIQWNITSQYEKNTIVIDPQSGTAYISVQPVPVGVVITNTDYWTVVFDLEQFVTKANSNFTVHVEPLTTLTATFPSAVNDWLIWGGKLYKALVNIVAGDQYVPDSNIRRITVEEVKDEIYTAFNGMIGDLADLTTTDKSNLVSAINEAITNITNEVAARAEADTVLQKNIDDEATARAEADTVLQKNIDDEYTALQKNIDDEATARGNADTEIMQTMGALKDLETEAKSNIVAAINEVNQKVLGAYDTADIRNYGGVGDGITNDTDAFNACMDANGCVYLPIISSSNPAIYLLDSITLNGNNNIIADFGASIRYTGSGYLFTIKGSNVKIIGVTAVFNNNGSFISIANTSGNVIREFILNNIITIGALHFIDDTASTSSYVSTYIDTVECKEQKGRCLNIHHSYAFLLIKDITSDTTGRTNNADFTHFWFENSAGMQLLHCEAEGGLIESYDVNNSGFYFKNCQAVWIDKCLADTCAGAGFYQDTGCKYFYISNSAASLCCGFGFLLNGSHNQLTGCWVIGRKGQTIVQSGAHGVNSYSDYTNIDNVMIFDVNGDGIAINSGRHLISNIQVHNSDVGIGNTANASGYIHDCDVSDNTTQVAPIAPMLYKDIFNGTTLWSNVT